MYTKTLIVAALVSFAEARFDQEHPEAITEIADVTSGGAPGEAATIAGGAISDLLAAANPCLKLQTGDNIIASLGMGADAVKAAQDFVAAEQNFNPFVQDIPTICSDPTLPTTAVLRGITPLIDPAVVGSDLANQLSAESLVAPFDATGLSVAGVLAAHGFTNFTTEDLAGNKSAASAAGTAAPFSNATVASNATVVSNTIAAATSAAAVVECSPPPPPIECTPPPATTLATVFTSSTSAAASTLATGTSSNSTVGEFSTVSSIAGVDFNLCTPTMKFEGGLDGRPATEFTFQAIDPKISAIQEEALNPNIITNRICDELTNQCESNQAAKDLCAQVQAQVLALGTKDVTTANFWNTGLGFAGTNTDPDGPAA